MAPQIIIPEYFNDRNAVVAIIDFGRFQFANSRGSSYNKTTTTSTATVISEDLSNSSDEEGNETLKFYRGHPKIHRSTLSFFKKLKKGKRRNKTLCPPPLIRGD